MSSNSTGYQAILVGNVGSKIEATPGHLKFTVKYETATTTGQVRTDTSKFVRCHLFGKYADVMAKYLKPGIKANFHGAPGDPIVWTLSDGTQRSANTMLVNRIEIHEYREAQRIEELEQKLAEMADKLNAAEDSLRAQASMIANATRTPDEMEDLALGIPVQQRIEWHDLPTIPAGDPEPPELPVIEEEDQGEPMPVF